MGVGGLEVKLPWSLKRKDDDPQNENWVTPAAQVKES